MGNKYVTANTSVGSATQPKVDISSSATSSITVPSGKTKFVIQNTGTKKVWFGDSNVNPTNKVGLFLVPTQMYEFSNVTSNLSIYFKCESGDTSTISSWSY